MDGKENYISIHGKNCRNLPSNGNGFATSYNRASFSSGFI